MGFLRSNKDSIISEWFMAMHDIGSVREGFAADVSLMDDHVSIRPLIGVKNALIIPYSQITDAFYGMKSELQQKQKSPIIRAAAGGLLFGHIGAVVGAVSALNPKQKKVNKFYFAFSYTDESGKDIVLWFRDTRLFKGRKLAAKLMEILGVE